MIIKYDSAKVSHPVYGVQRRVLAYNEKIMLSEHILEKGAVLPEHNHPHEQLVYLLKGEITINLGEERLKMGSGDSLVIPSGVSHKVTAITKSVALDIFTPARQDYL
ncbi:MAG TPA: cupin domain-containing protein [Dehalococcoidales bacterium]|nr:cupin domain-containing protein [Dehalococcoidales bacterium]